MQRSHIDFHHGGSLNRQMPSWRNVLHTFRLLLAPLAAAVVLNVPAAGTFAQSITPTQPITSDPIGPVYLQTQNLIVNGSFEIGTVGWTRVESPTLTFSRHHCGAASMNFGNLGNGALLQELTIPASASRADFGYWLLRDGTGSGQLTVAVFPPVSTNPNAAPLQTLNVHSAGNTSSTAWTRYYADLSQFKGQTIRLQFTLSGFNPSSPINFFLDDVSLWTGYVLSLAGSC